MLRLLLLATFALVSSGAATGQTLGTLRVTIVLTEADGTATPAPRHALLVSDDPPTAEPRRIMTGPDGTVQVSLRPGHYTVESDRPLAFRGRRYQWVQTIDVAAGRETLLAFTFANAEAGDSADTAASTSGSATGSDPEFLLNDWQPSVFAIWTPRTRISGFLADAKGLVVTTHRDIGTVSTVEVQLSSTVKVAARPLASAGDVAVVWIDPSVVAGVRPVPLTCPATAPALDAGTRLFTLGAPLRGDKDMASGRVLDATAAAIGADFVLSSGGVGGPVFAEDGAVVGLTSLAPADAETRERTVRVIPARQVCDVLAAAAQSMTTSAPPSATRLPVEPSRPFPVDALTAALEKRAGSTKPYLFSSADFDVALLTPIAVHADLNASMVNRRTTSKETRDPKADFDFIRPRMDFGGWADYVADIRPVLLVRLTPRFVEGFWTKVGRVAAETQGVMLPQVKRYKAGFGRLRVLCGSVEVVPIHPFDLDTRITETATIDEGLYVFDPGALGPHCGAVTFQLESAAEPGKIDTRVVDPKIIEQVWLDFAPFRDAAGAARN